MDFAQYQSELEIIGAVTFDKLAENLPGEEIGKGKRKRTVEKPADLLMMTFDSGGSAKQKTNLGLHRTNGWNVNGVDVDLIAINPYTLQRSAVSIAETVVHEMLHHFASASDISDTSRGGYYHGLAYRELCDASGLLEWVEDEKYGCTTKLSADGESWVAEILQPNFGNMFKNMEAAPKRKKNSAVKFECGCGTKAVVTSAKSVDDGFVPMCGFKHEPVEMTRVIAEEED